MSPAMPAQPAQPAQPGGTPYQSSPEPQSLVQSLLPLLLRAMQPQNPSASMGGFQAPPAGSPQASAGIPGIPTPVAPSSIPKGTQAPQSYPLANVSGQPGGPPSIDPAAVVSQAQENHTVGKETLQTQFEKLQEQRKLLALPDSTEGTYHAPSEDLKDQITDWMGNYVAYASRPREVGGLGMSAFNARIAAQVQARRSFPKINPDDLAAFAQTAGEGSKDIPGRGGVEIGPQRVAREFRNPTDLARVLAKDKTQDYLKEARAYRETAGASASAEGFTNHLFSKWQADSAVEGEKVGQYTKDYEVAKAQLGLRKTQAADDEQKKRIAEALAKLELRHKENLAKASKGVTEAEMVARLTQDAQEVSAAAALAELY